MIDILNILKSRLKNQNAIEVLSKGKFALWELKSNKDQDGYKIYKLEIFLPEYEDIEYIYDEEIFDEIVDCLTEYENLQIFFEPLENLDELEMMNFKNDDTYFKERILLERLLEE